jgi:hypothetical protein
MQMRLAVYVADLSSTEVVCVYVHDRVACSCLIGCLFCWLVAPGLVQQQASHMYSDHAWLVLLLLLLDACW